MSKKLMIFMAIVSVGMLALIFQFKIRADRKGPEITYSKERLIYTDGMTNAELLDGVKAHDEVEGDVTDALAVETVFTISDTEAVVVYVAKDSKNNITKVQRTIEYDNSAKAAEVAEETVAEAEAKPVEEAPAEPVEEVPAEPTPTPTPELTPEELARQEQEATATAMPPQNPRMYLTEYLVKVPVGTSVDQLSYVKDITDDVDDKFELWKKIQITGTLNTAAAGTYELTYYVVDANNNVSNMAKLTFVVE